MYSAFFLLLLCLGLASSQSCNDTYATTFVQTINLKQSSPYKLRLGIVGAYGAPEVNAVKGIAHVLNNDMSILPDVEIQIYNSSAPNPTQTLLAALYQIRTLNIHGMISGTTSTESRTAQLGAKLYSIPQISGNTLSFALSNKDEYPYFMRTSPPDAFQIDGIVALFQQMGWKRGIIIYTTDDYGGGNTRLITAAQDKNISLIAFGVSPTASTAAAVKSTADAVIQAAKAGEYRIFVFYTQFFPGYLIRNTMVQNASLSGPEYVYIFTAPMMGAYTSGFFNDPLNEGHIGTALGIPNGPLLAPLFARWKNSTNNPFPAPASAAMVFGASWYSVDALLTFAYAVDNLMNEGIPFEWINTTTLYSAMINTTFPGATGDIVYNNVGDRLGNYDFYTMGANFTKKVGFYNAFSEKYNQTGEYIFAGGTKAIPRDGPYVCKACEHGTCVVDVGCVCDKGYHGSYCNLKDENNGTLIGIVVGVATVFIIGAVAGFFVYRKKRSQLVKQVAEKQRSNITRADLVLGNRIGRGASGEVFKATFRGTEVAVKKIIAANADNKVIEEFELEVAIMCGLRHPNIILFMGSSFDTATKEMLLVMEFMTRGSLHDVLHNQKISLNYDMSLHLACQAAQGMNFLHMSTPPIIHSDLKSHNILLDDKWNARISDFGITKFKGSTKRDKPEGAENSIGTIFWTAPETLDGTDHTEKSDVYSFGIVLWEIFHRKDPYAGRDPLAVALEVIRSNLRPHMDPNVPTEMKDLICACWHKDADKRPTFQEVMTTLRALSLKNPMYHLSGQGGATRVDAPTGLVYLVNTTNVAPLTVWDAEPKYMCEALKLQRQMIRTNMEMYRGYEAKSDLHNFLIAFATAEDAVNFCIATQVSLLHVEWPEPILRLPMCTPVMSPNGSLWWKGLRMRMSVLAGVPNCEIDSSTGRVVYIGTVVEKSRKLLRRIHAGSILITDEVLNETTKKGVRFVQDMGTEKIGDLNVSARSETSTSPIHEVIIRGFEGRDMHISGGSSKSHPHVLLDVEEIPMGDNASVRTDAEIDWVAHTDDIDVKEALGKGSTGDYHRAYWKNKEVAVKTLVNQKLKEDDQLRLMSDAAYMSKLTHANLLSFYSVCLDESNIALVSEFMPRGNLKAILADASISLSLVKRVKIAQEIAQGMGYLSMLDYEDIRKHDNLKSNNILIGKDWEVKIADYGQSNIKDLARTMTSVGSVAWTAPEILNGEMECSPKIATYSFGIICWELLTRQVPYANEHPIRVVNKILGGYRPTIPADCPASFRKTIEQCLDADPEERPSWDAIMSSLSATFREL